jgi:hypothetical protein
VTSLLDGGGGSASHPSRFTPRKRPESIVQDAGSAPGLVWTCAKDIAPTGIRSPDHPARSKSLYRLSYPAHHHHTFGIISNHKMERDNIGNFQNIPYVVRFIHLHCTPITLSQYGQIQRFSMRIMKIKHKLEKKHICQKVYIHLSFHMMAVKLQLIIFCTSPCLFHSVQQS